MNPPSNSLNSSTRIFLFSLLLLISGLSIQVSGQPYTSIPFSSFLIDGPMYFYNMRGMDWGDIDGDGDWEIVCATYFRGMGSRYHMIICENDGANNFSWGRTLGYDNSLRYGRVELVDFDNDNLPEIFVAGEFMRDAEEDMITDSRVEIYKYNGTSATKVYSYVVNSASIRTSGCADFDLDGDVDFHFGGRIFQNNNMSFEVQSYYYKTDYPEIFWSDDLPSRRKADIDDDGDPDSLSYSTININLAGAAPFSKPSTPVPLSTGMNEKGQEMSLYWDQSTDNDSPDSLIGYNLRVGTSPGTSDIISPMTSPSENIRSTTFGNAGLNTGSRILISDKLNHGSTYYWSVQSIDEDGLCSPFSQEQAVNYNQFQSTSAGKSQIAGHLIPVDLDNDGTFEIISSAKLIENYHWPEIFTVLDAVCNELPYSIPEIGDILLNNIQVGDFNNDNLVDVLGMNFYNYTKPVIMRNNGDRTFTTLSLPEVGSTSSLSAADIDNDGDLDILTGGRILSNQGAFQFTLLDSTYVAPPVGSNSQWVDYDNDLDLDVYHAGLGQLYSNTGGKFKPVSTGTITVNNSSTDWGDYNNDGYLDLLITGNDSTGVPVAKIYQNDGKNLNQIDVRLIGIGQHEFYNAGEYAWHYQRSYCRWGDFDNDGYLDIGLYGADMSGAIVTEIMWNDQRGEFYSNQSGFSDCQAGSLIVGDLLNQDGILDIAFTGAYSSSVYKNASGYNYQPAAPSNLDYEQLGYDILFHWNSGGDQESGENLTYNLRVGTSPGSHDILSPSADLNTGKRYIVEKGLTGMSTSWKLSNLPAGTYYWSVQAIDQAYNGGAWASESSFTVSSVDADFEADTVCHDLTTSFTDNTVSYGETITGWHWDFGDGNTSSIQHPYHTYSSPGNYSVQLISRTNSTSDTAEHDVLIKPSPSASMFVDITCHGNPSQVFNMTQINGATISEWKWDFGDGTYSDLEDPGLHEFLSPGDFNVQLEVLATNGCSDTAYDIASVGAFPIASITMIGNSVFCDGDSIIISSYHDENYIYEWELNGIHQSFGDTSSIAAKNSGIYTVDVTHLIGYCRRTSNALEISSVVVPASPTISAASETEICQGDSVELNINFNADHSYQWKLNGGAVGTNSNIYYAKTDGTYTVDVTNSSGCLVTSLNNIVVTIINKPSIPTVSVNGLSTICTGENVNLSVTNNLNVSYQWYNGAVTVGGATTSSIDVDVTGDYSLLVTNGNGCKSETTPVSITVNPSPASPTIIESGPSAFCDGGSTTLSVTDNPLYTYQWKFGGGATGSDQNTLIVTSSGTYSLDVTNGSGCTTPSANMPVITVNDLPTVPTVNVSGVTTFCAGGTVNLNVDQEAGMSYQWYNGAVTVGGATTNSLDAAISGDYKLFLSNGSGCVSETLPVSVTVNPNPSAPTISESGPSTFCNGGNVTLSVSDDPQLTYKWLFNGGATGSDVNEHTITSSGNYSLEVSNSYNCAAAATNPVSVVVNNLPTVPTVNVSGVTTFCAGGIVNLNVNQEAGMSYQWYNGGTTVGGATTNSIDADVTGDYKLTITNDLSTCVSETPATSVTVNPTPTSTSLIKSGPTTFCDVDSVVLSVTDDPTLSYQWLLNGGAVGTDLNEHIVKTGGNYSLEVSNDFMCKAASNTVAVIVYLSPVTPTVGVNGATAFCEGQSVDLSVTNDLSLNYQWMNGDVGVGGAITNSFSASATGDYRLSISNSDGCTVETQVINVIADPAPTAPTIGYTGVTEFCDTESLVLSVADNPNYTYEWQLNGGTVGTNSSSYTANATGSYTVKVQNLGDCFAMSANTVGLIVHASPSNPTLNLSGPTKFCEDKNVTLSVSDPGTDSYQWISELGEMTDETGTSISVDETGFYKVRIRSGLCEAFSQAIDVSVNPYPITPVILSENYEKDACQDEDPIILSLETEETGIVYQWKRNGIPISDELGYILTGYLEEGEYSVSAMSNNCSVESQTLSIQYAEMPEKPEILAEGPVVWYLACSSDSATAYKWYVNGIEIEGADEYLYVAGTLEGKFEVAISENNSCFAKSEPMWLPLGTGVDLDPWENLKIYPNPTPGLFTLEMDNHLMGELIIDIFGETGSKIINIKFHKETSHFKTQIDLSEQPPAAYLIGLMLDKYRTNRILIVE